MTIKQKTYTNWRNQYFDRQTENVYKLEDYHQLENRNTLDFDRQTENVYKLEDLVF